VSQPVKASRAHSHFSDFVVMGLVNGIGLRLTLCGLLTSRSLVRPKIGDMTSQQLGKKSLYEDMFAVCKLHGLLTAFFMPGGAGCSCMP